MLVETVHEVHSHYLYVTDFPKIKESAEREGRMAHMQKLAPYYLDEKRGIRSISMGEEWRRGYYYRYKPDIGIVPSQYRIVDDRSMFFILRNWITFTDPLCCKVGDDVSDADFCALFQHVEVKDERFIVSRPESPHSITYPRPMTFCCILNVEYTYWRRVA